MEQQDDRKGDKFDRISENNILEILIIAFVAFTIMFLAIKITFF